MPENQSKQGPFLRAALMDVLDYQLRENDPPETRQTFERLKAEDIEDDETRRLLGCVIAGEIFAVMKTKQAFDRERFTSRLRMLPEMPWLED
jgi:hypothetical protein